MILVWMILILMVGGLLALFLEKTFKNFSRWISLAALSMNLIISVYIWLFSPVGIQYAQTDWIISVKANWISEFGITFFMALDGFSLLLLMLTFFLGIISVVVSWDEIKEKTGFFHFNILWIIAGITGVFVALDLFLFYFFWEVMLIPMYFLIGIWGHENRMYAAYKFFIFTQASGLLMFIAILALYFIHGSQTGVYTFDYTKLLGTEFTTETGRWLSLGFLAAFLVKLPVVPVHNWLPDAHTQAPTAGSVILAGLLLKTGAYGIFRFVLPLFPEASLDFSVFGMLLGVVGVLYGAKVAFAQTDFKRLVAYSSVSHMGFVIIGLYSFNVLAFQGVIIQMIAHGISTGALFIVAGTLQNRIHTRDIESMGGLWETTPLMGGVTMLFAMASLGLPGLGNFVAEFLTLVGAYQANPLLTVFATLGLIASTLYSLKILQSVFHGVKVKNWTLADLNKKELAVFGSMIVMIVWLGLYPKPFIKTAEPFVNKVEQIVKKTSIIYTAWNNK